MFSSSESETLAPAIVSIFVGSIPRPIRIAVYACSRPLSPAATPTLATSGALLLRQASRGCGSRQLCLARFIVTSSASAPARPVRASSIPSAFGGLEIDHELGLGRRCCTGRSAGLAPFRIVSTLTTGTTEQVARRARPVGIRPQAPTRLSGHSDRRAAGRRLAARTTSSNLTMDLVDHCCLAWNKLVDRPGATCPSVSADGHTGSDGIGFGASRGRQPREKGWSAEAPAFIRSSRGL